MKPNSKHPYRPDFAPKLTVDGFMDAFEDNKEGFKHLQIFLNKSACIDFGDHYLMLGKNSFGVVQLIDIDYKDEKIVIDLLDVKAQTVFQLPIYIHKRGFQGMFWKLDDIREMIRETENTEAKYHFDTEENTEKGIEDLLELDENQQMQQL